MYLTSQKNHFKSSDFIYKLKNQAECGNVQHKAFLCLGKTLYKNMCNDYEVVTGQQPTKQERSFFVNFISFTNDLMVKYMKPFVKDKLTHSLTVFRRSFAHYLADFGYITGEQLKNYVKLINFNDLKLQLEAI